MVNEDRIRPESDFHDYGGCFEFLFLDTVFFGWASVKTCVTHPQQVVEENQGEPQFT